MSYKIEPLGDEAIIIRFLPCSVPNIHRRIQFFIHILNEKPFDGFVEAVSAYETVTIYYVPLFNLGCSPFEYVCSNIERLLSIPIQSSSLKNRTIKIPVCYDPEVGPDLPLMASKLKLSIDDIIKLHSAPLYEVSFIGFSPGFPFLSGMDERLSFPRKSTPRLKIPPGSVGIAGGQTGIYSLETPGGWNIIGRTPITLFNSQQSSPSFFRQGDFVKFVPISYSSLQDWKEELWQFE